MEDTEKMLSKVTLSMLMFDDIEFERGNALTPSVKRDQGARRVDVSKLIKRKLIHP